MMCDRCIMSYMGDGINRSHVEYMISLKHPPLNNYSLIPKEIP